MSHRRSRGEGAWGACFLALLLSGSACTTSRPDERDVAPDQTEQAAPTDLFPDLTSDLERQMAAQRQEALARGAAEKARELDPFSADELEGRLRELGVRTFAGCLTDPDGFREMDSMTPHRLLAASDYRALEPTFREGGPSRRVEVRAAIVPVVMISCTVEVEAQPVASGGFVAAVDEIEFTALFDRALSWWNPEREGDEIARLNGQLHFDIAHLLAKEANRAGGRVLRGGGLTERAARDELQIQLANRIGDIEDELRRITDQLDLETSKGYDARAVRTWEDRVRHGLGAVRRELPPDTP